MTNKQNLQTTNSDQTVLSDSAYLDIAKWPKGCRYTVEQRVNALATYVSHGNLRRTERETKIPENTIRYWRDKSPWWDSQVATIRAEKNQELDAELSQIIHKANKEQLDRLTQGDEIITKDGDKLRRLVTGRDAATIGAIAFDKRQIIRNQPTSITHRTTDERLDYLADRLRTLDNVLKPAINAESTENVTEVIDD